MFSRLGINVCTQYNFYIRWVKMDTARRALTRKGRNKINQICTMAEHDNMKEHGMTFFSCYLCVCDNGLSLVIPLRERGGGRLSLGGFSDWGDSLQIQLQKSNKINPSDNMADPKGIAGENSTNYVILMIIAQGTNGNYR